MTQAAPAPTGRPNVDATLWYHILGGAFLGFWLIWALLKEPAWFTWGLFGLFIAIALYGARATGDILRIALWIVVGLSIGAVLAFMFIDEQVNLVATLITASGAGLIAAGLPVPHDAHTTNPPQSGWAPAEPQGNQAPPQQEQPPRTMKWAPAEDDQAPTQPPAARVRRAS